MLMEEPQEEKSVQEVEVIHAIFIVGDLGKQGKVGRGCEMVDEGHCYGEKNNVKNMGLDSAMSFDLIGVVTCSQLKTSA